MFKFLIKSLVLASIFSNSIAQFSNPEIFKSPLDIPLFLSGNYGELRAGHFHAGIDLKTQGVTGKPVFATAEGYVSRINIQTGGYGKSIYITHPNGYITVYAHLERFIPEIQKFVENEQYENKKFEIELFPEKELFRFLPGEIIAYSGNTGSSGGPHLHFEIRNTDSQVPMNGLLFNLPIADNLPPVFKTFYLYNYPYSEPVFNAGEKRLAYAITKKDDATYSVKGPMLITSPYFSFGAEVYDYLNGSANRCGIYSMQLNIDNKPYISYTMDGISFDQSRYVNAHMDYELKTNQKKSVHRLFPLKNNKLSIYKRFGRNELYKMLSDSMHRGEIVAIDSYGNESRLNFSFRQSVVFDSSVNWQDSLDYIRWKQGATYLSNKINIRIPPEALYEDILFNYKIIAGAESALSDTFSIFTPDEPLHENMQIEVPLTLKNSSLEDKVLFGRIDQDNKLVSEGGSYNDGVMSVATRSFGKFVITCDTVAPVIIPVNFMNEKKYTAGQRLTFNVSDELSGLFSYNAYIDEEWILLEYDAKSDTMDYIIDKNRLVSGQAHKLKLVMVDRKNNRSEFEGKFVY
jgi:murein DD-endopeptidase MepM/ murein hydrolase activator NlpD